MAIRIRIVMLLLSLVTMLSCKSEYDRYVRRELATGVVNDSLIFGMRMGQTQKDFYAQCWDLNKQELIAQGKGNQMARYVEPLDTTGDLTLRKEMEFYGIFDEDKVMHGMDMVFAFTAWGPWMRNRFSDSLALRLKKQFLRDYGGNEFITIDLENLEYDAYVKIDGNRQILIYPMNRREVAVKIEDLNYKLSKE